MSRPDLRVLYVLGIYHSGTTVLGNLLGQLDGFFSVGELRTVWRKLAAPGTRCGCGQRVGDCPVWRKILARLGDSGDRAALARDMHECQRAVLGQHHTWLRVPALLRHRAASLPSGSPLARYAAGLASLYQAIASETGANIIVDSSKEPTDAALLMLMPGIDARFVQIVRDPRGTVFSILRFADGKPTPASNASTHGKPTADSEPTGGSQWRRSAYAALSWSAGNLAGTAVRRAAGPDRAMLLHYEDLVRGPHETIEAVATFAGQPALLAADGEPGTVHMHPTHTVGGNNNRFRTGTVHFREDTAWQSGLHPLDRAAVTTVCAPLMARYGYRLTRNS